MYFGTSETSGSLGRVWFRKGFWDGYRGRKSRSREKNKEETNVSKLGSKIGATEDNIPGAKVQTNDNLAPCNGPEDFAKQNSAQATTCF